MDEFKQAVRDTSYAVKIGIFCAIITALTFPYEVLDPVIAVIVRRISIVTLIMNIIIITFKYAFGSIKDPLSIVALISMYFSLLSFALFGWSQETRWLGTIVFVVVIIKIAIFIFGNKKPKAPNVCPSCGSPVSEGKKFCGKCGAKL